MCKIAYKPMYTLSTFEASDSDLKILISGSQSIVRFLAPTSENHQNRTFSQS